jgi:hypothetical protein
MQAAMFWQPENGASHGTRLGWSSPAIYFMTLFLLCQEFVIDRRESADNRFASPSLDDLALEKDQWGCRRRP